MHTSATHRRADIAGIVSLLVTVLFFASIPVFLKFLALRLDGWTVNGVRYSIAALFWAPWVLRGGRGRLQMLFASALPAALVNMCGQTCWALSAYHNDAGVMGFMARLSFAFTVLFSYLLLPGERSLLRSRPFWLSVAVIAAGMLVFYRAGASLGRTSRLGMALLLATAVCWGMYSVLVRQRMSAYPPWLSFGAVSLITAPGLLVMLFLFGDWRALTVIPWSDWMLLVSAALVGITFGHALLYRAIRGLGAVAAEGGLLAMPFATAAMAALALHERLSPGQWTGGIIVLAGCALLLRTRVAVSLQDEGQS
ncbi:MAG: hypothetical protein DRP22_00960 [Verrucomicrobia bacterium]|nr:MAG: hypothetical protein DRP22_00960 [Verrucomicrobiota bacterium]